VKGYFGNSEPHVVAKTSLLKTFRLSIKMPKPPLKAEQKLPFDINMRCRQDVIDAV